MVPSALVSVSLQRSPEKALAVMRVEVDAARGRAVANPQTSLASAPTDRKSTPDGKQQATCFECFAQDRDLAGRDKYQVQQNMFHRVNLLSTLDLRELEYRRHHRQSRNRSLPGDSSKDQAEK